MPRIIKQARCATVKAELITQKTFKTTINAHDVVCICCYAEWMQGRNAPENYAEKFDRTADILAKLYPRGARKKGIVHLVKLNCDNDKTFARELNAWCLPIYVIFKNGERLEVSFTDRLTVDNLLQFIEQFIDKKKEHETYTHLEPKGIRSHYMRVGLITLATYTAMVKDYDYVLIVFCKASMGNYAAMVKLVEDTARALDRFYPYQRSRFVKVKWRGQVTVKCMDCTDEEEYKKIKEKFRITYFPTFKLVRFGVMGVEYHGERTVDGLVNFIKYQIKKKEDSDALAGIPKKVHPDVPV